MPVEIEPIPNNMLAGVSERYRDGLQAFKVGGFLYLWLGVRDTGVYNNPSVIALLEHLKERRGARIAIVAPPIAIDNGQGDNGLLELARKEVIDLRIRPNIGMTAPHIIMETSQGIEFHAYQAEGWKDSDSR